MKTDGKWVAQQRDQSSDKSDCYACSNNYRYAFCDNGDCVNKKCVAVCNTGSNSYECLCNGVLCTKTGF
jgi:hypothetical protein